VIPLVETVADAAAADAVMGIGTSPLRKEDGPLLRGSGCFIGDFKRPGAVQALVVRSSRAHARIVAIDRTAALAAPGVIDVITAEDLPSSVRIPMRQFRDTRSEEFLQPPLAREVVRYSGEPVAVIIAESRYLAEDAAQLFEVEYEPLPAVLDGAASVAADAPLLHPQVDSNVAGEVQIELGPVDECFATADLVVEHVFRVQRHAAVPLETRGLLAEYDRERDAVTVWGAAKIPHVNKKILARLLGWEDEDRVRLVELHVGGGFGARGEFYPEDFLIPFCAIRTGLPVAWVEDREENLRATNHSREQIHRVAAAVRADGTLLAVTDELINNQGAYVRTHGMTVPAMSAAMLVGPYAWAAYRCQMRSVVSNKTPAGTYRAPGRFEANFVRERLIDIIAHRLGRDPVDLRRQNLIDEGSFPYEVGTHYDGHPVIYDSGRYELLLDKCLHEFDYDGMRRWREELGPANLRRGVGLGYFVEKAGPAEKEYARVELDGEGNVVVYSGSASVGQGVETVLAQVCASHLGVAYDRISVRHGDTAVIPEGMGAFGSRAAMLGGAATMMAAAEVRARLLELAAQELEAAPEDLVIGERGVAVRGAPWREVAWSRIVERNGGDVIEEGRYRCDLLGYPYGIHLAAVEVDTDTGGVRIDRYAVAYDVGRCINPMLIRGQISGGAAQGVGGALLEEFVYDAEGQPLAASFMDYLMPTASEMPSVEIFVTEDAPSPLNPLGVKGAGEGGTSAVGATLANAVSDALGIEVTQLPLSPDRINEALGAPS
jgi:aerobic carbon-monoxide dehydrogenase large subunit